jgi:hypothetical protein
MTLQEAHKTGRKYREVGVGSGSWYFRFSDSASFPMDVVMAEYEVEPEVHEVECRIEGHKSGGLSIIAIAPFDGDDIKKLLDIAGKRVKATFEVID